MIGTLKAATYVILAISIALLLLTFSGREISATDYESAYSTTLSDTSPGANADSDSPFDVETGTDNTNWLILRNTTSSTAFRPSMDHEIPDGAGVGKVDFNVTLGLINGACGTSVPGSIPMLDSTTDITHTADFEGTGTNLVMDDDNDGIVEDDGDGEDNNDVGEDDNGVPTYADHYPSFLNLMFDPDGPGAKPPIQPRARYMGHQVVVDGVPPTFLQLVVFNPGDLGDATNGLPEPDAALSDSFGFPSFILVNNPTAAAAPSAITDWCATTSVTRLLGTTEGQWSVIDGPEPVEFDRGGHCFGAQIGVDNDGDTVIDDGCLFLDTGTNAGIVRTENPAAFSGIYDTGTQLVRSYSQSYRDADGDGISNDLDPCTVTADSGNDVDNDGLDDIAGPLGCDLNTAIGSSPPTETDNGTDEDGDNAVYETDGIDNDGDTVIDETNEGVDEDPFDNKDNDGDGMVDEDGGCTGVQGLPDADQDCFPNRGDNCPQLPNDGRDLDITVPSGPATDNGMMWDNIGDACDASGPVPETAGQCANDTDDDGDGLANDGCPIIPTPPNAFYDKQNFEDPQVFPSVNGSAGLGSCTDGLDNGNVDGLIDILDPDCFDGQEWGAQCQNFTDDDADTVVNDGCPAAGGGTPSGHFHTILITSYICIADGSPGPDAIAGNADDADDTDNNGNPDDDGDGVCDSTEEFLDSCSRDPCDAGLFPGLIEDSGAGDGSAPPDETLLNGIDDDGDTAIDEGAPGSCDDTIDNGSGDGADIADADDCVDLNGDGDANAADSTPEYEGLEYPDLQADNNGDTVPESVPGVCNDLDWQPGGTGIDNDRDGDTNGADSGCQTNPVIGREDGAGGPPFTCNDGIDNGGDTFTDSDDPDCRDTDKDGIANRQCGDDNVDDDGDTNVNDGCPPEGSPEDPSCVNDVDDDGDTNVNDGCPQKGGAPEDPSCVDAIDNAEDGPADGEVNDGCPAKGDPETDIPGACDSGDAIDDDADTRVNDGCPAVLISEADADGCAEDPAIDDDGDTRVNDGCPAKDAPESPECANDIDDDGDTRVNDGCPQKGAQPEAPGPGDNCNNINNLEQMDSDNNGQGNDCDTDDDGDGIDDVDERGTDPRSADTDGDTVLDPTDNCPNVANAGQQNAVHSGTTKGDHCEDAEPDQVVDFTDNCPDDINSGQADMDSDGAGDACDPDIDGDGYWNDDETAKGSDTLVAGETPEHCDGVDNDGDTVTDEEPAGADWDTDGDTVKDCLDTDVFGTDYTATTNDDAAGGDTVTDVNEHWMSTDSLSACPSDKTTTKLHDAWGSDNDHNGKANIGDVIQLFGNGKILKILGDPLYSKRSDFDGNGKANIGDVIMGFGGGIIMTSC